VGKKKRPTARCVKPLSAGFPEAPASPGSLQPELVFMFASPTQLSTVIWEGDGPLANSALLVETPASSGSLEPKFVLVLADEAQRTAVLRVTWNWKRNEQQSHRPEKH
jgi:hypothetical protein